MSTATRPTPPPKPSNGAQPSWNARNGNKLDCTRSPVTSGLADAAVAASPASSEVVARPSGGQPAALQDVDFYTSVANELPEGSPVLSSILYSHRSVATTVPTADEQLDEVNSTIAKFREDAKIKAAQDIELQLAQLRQEQVDHQKDLMRRDVEHNHAWKRMEDMALQLEKRIEADLSSDSATATQFTDAWRELGQRRLNLEEQLKESYRSLERTTLEDQRNKLELERMAQQSKTIINEAVTRSVMRADEEATRLSMSFQYRNEAVLRLTEADNSKERMDIMGSEQRAFSLLHELCIDDFRRAERITNVQRSFTSLLHHVAASEKGMRFNVTMDEERSWIGLLEETSKRRVVLDLVELAVTGSIKQE